ncbi:HAD-IA family hydrolase [Reinekea blandensis]|uniref:Uncharacterized protein n=1 Tax=Reinekea blandensis MED297 TaxID=314283 RepID=A4B9J0_9GAMM|nr:HAD-IA family hydrolase [Reinekea blandensis]EAR11291.1 hypothetical protein MED297_20427 [Reinekea sp. MED297] [Reinekea blandensis MED297]
MIKAVITDFDGVLRHWTRDKTGAVEAHCKLSPGTLSAICFQKDLLEPAIRGTCTKDVWFEQAHERLKTRYGQGIADNYLEAWKTERYRIDHDLLARYRELFPEANLVLATNATSGLPAELNDADLSMAFSAMFNSSAMGVIKPERQYFQAVLMSLGLTAREVVFIDDSSTNVQAAAELGIPTVHYRSQTQVVNDLTDLALQSCLTT